RRRDARATAVAAGTGGSRSSDPWSRLMPEAPQMQALAERVAEAAAGRTLARIEPMQFAALKTFDPDPMSLRGRTLHGVGRRGKFLVLDFGDGLRVLVHLSQGGRVDIEDPPKTTKGT